jgi:hypothetical protein
MAAQSVKTPRHSGSMAWARRRLSESGTCCKNGVAGVTNMLKPMLWLRVLLVKNFALFATSW